MYIQTIFEKELIRKVHFKICDLFQPKKLLETKIVIMTIVSDKHVGQNTAEI